MMKANIVGPKLSMNNFIGLLLIGVMRMVSLHDLKTFFSLVIV